MKNSLQEIKLNHKILRAVLLPGSVAFVQSLILRNRITRKQMAPRVRVFIRNGDYLLISRYMGGFGKWDCQGGGVDQGESSIDCAVRETLEEMRIVAPKECFRYLGVVSKDHKNHYDRICYELDLSTPDMANIVIRPNLEIYKAKWVKISDLENYKNVSSTITGYLYKSFKR